MKKFRSYVLLAALTVVMSVMFSSCIQFESERTLEIHNYSGQSIKTVRMIDSSGKVFSSERNEEVCFYGSGKFTVYIDLLGVANDVVGYVNVPEDPKIIATIKLNRRKIDGTSEYEYYIEDITKGF